MALPQLNTAKFTLILPTNGKEIEYRQFLVGEEKILLTALETEDKMEVFNAVKHVIDVCTFNKLDVNDLAILDLEFVFLQLRIKSKGEVSEIVFPCDKCDKDIHHNIDLTKIKPIGENPDPVIRLTESIGIKLLYPTTKIMNKLDDNDSSKMDVLLNIVKESIESVYSANEVIPRNEISDEELDIFINSTSTKQFEMIQNFFESIPKLKTIENIKCSGCGHSEEITLEGIQNFLG